MSKKTPAKVPSDWLPPKGISISHRKDRDTWVVAYRVPGEGGADAKKKLERETFPTKGLAVERAKEVAGELKLRGETGLRSLTGRAVVEYERIIDAIGDATVDQLLAVWERHKGEVLRGESKLTVAVAIERFLALKGSEETSDEALGHLEKRLSRVSEAFGARPILSITHEELRAWMDRLRKEEKFAAWTRIHHHKAAMALFSHAVSEGWRIDNPMSKVAAPPKPKTPVTFMTPEDGAKLLKANAHLPVSMRMALEMFGGLRFSGTNRLEESEVDWDAKGIRIPAHKAKDGKAHYLEGMPDNVWSWLTPWRGKPAAWAPLSKRMLQYEKTRAFERAGVKNSGNELRHSFCTYLIAWKKDAALCAYLMQHRAPSMLYDHYRGCATEAAGKSWFEIKRENGVSTEVPEARPRDERRPGQKGRPARKKGDAAAQ